MRASQPLAGTSTCGTAAAWDSCKRPICQLFSTHPPTHRASLGLSVGGGGGLAALAEGLRRQGKRRREGRQGGGEHVPAGGASRHLMLLVAGFVQGRSRCRQAAHSCIPTAGCTGSTLPCPPLARPVTPSLHTAHKACHSTHLGGGGGGGLGLSQLGHLGSRHARRLGNRLGVGGGHLGGGKHAAEGRAGEAGVAVSGRIGTAVSGGKRQHMQPTSGPTSVGKVNTGAAALLTITQLPHCPAHQMGMVVPAWAAALATAVARPAAPPWAVAEAEAWANACRQRGERKVAMLMSADG